MELESRNSHGSMGWPNVGKSLLAADIIGRVTTGTAFPDHPDVRAMPGDVVVLSAEDDPGDTWKPRLLAAGADTSRVHWLESVRRNRRGRDETFDLSLDLHRLAMEIKRRPSLRLIVLDPLSAFLGGLDSHRDASVRSLLSPLTAMAAKHGVAVIGIAHLSKRRGGSAMSRIAGSIAFVGASRAAWAVGVDPADSTRRGMASIKGNLGPEQSPIAFNIETVQIDGVGDVPRVVWSIDTVSFSPEDLIRASEQGRGRESEVDRAVAWIRSFLADGPKTTTAVFAAGQGKGHSQASLKRAKKIANVVTKKTATGWFWQLGIGVEGAQNAKA